MPNITHIIYGYSLSCNEYDKLIFMTKDARQDITWYGDDHDIVVDCRQNPESNFVNIYPADIWCLGKSIVIGVEVFCSYDVPYGIVTLSKPDRKLQDMLGVIEKKNTLLAQTLSEMEKLHYAVSC